MIRNSRTRSKAEEDDPRLFVKKRLTAVPALTVSVLSVRALSMQLEAAKREATILSATATPIAKPTAMRPTAPTLKPSATLSVTPSTVARAKPPTVRPTTPSVTPPATTSPAAPEAQSSEMLPLTGMQIYLLDRYHGIGTDRQLCRYAVLQLSCGVYDGWSEELVAVGGEPFDLIRWACCLQPLRRMTMEQAWQTAWKYRSRWGEARSHLVLSALLELESRLDKTHQFETVDQRRAFDRQPDWLNRLPSEPNSEELFNRATAYFDIL
ncbi:hypothetical protein [Paenibacillus herberti]|uniref:Uncharacterized protein n=1 Tax=Paenibacillus herberti TaxID=1619309 RepID=A0A229NVX5_9BACL|nr:hypothetical protein [Paenibacillus herberti]OXM13875.1 hypothetical protein CGZ75_12725 [Paenibacillus herberti]